jgi:TolB protein
VNIRLASASLALLAATVAQADLPVLQISGANFRPMPLALPAPLAPSVPTAEASEFDNALLFDLTAAGIFQVLERKGFLADAKEGLSAASISFRRWSDVGAEALVKTQLSMDGGNLRGELKLFSVGAGKEELSLSESVPSREPRRLAHLFADAVYRHFTREPGPFRSKLAFVRRTTGDKEVWVSDWDGKNGQQITEGGINVLPALAPDLQTVGFTSYRRGKPEIFAQRIGGSATPLVHAGQLAVGIAFSPDGRRIAYSLAQGESAQIWVARTDGSDARALTNTPYFINSSPTWSPDGKRLAFVSNRSGSPQLYVMSAEGKEVRRLTFKGNYNQTPDWSPRGDLIAFTARDERNVFDLFTIHVETGKINRLTQNEGNNEEPSFSPNGRLVLFSSTRSGRSQLFVMTAEGNNQTRLPLESADYLTPDWGSLPR